MFSLSYQVSMKFFPQNLILVFNEELSLNPDVSSYTVNRAKHEAIDSTISLLRMESLYLSCELFHKYHLLTVPP